MCAYYLQSTDWINSPKAARNYWRKNGFPDMTCADIITISNSLDYGIYFTDINNDTTRGISNSTKWYCRSNCPIFYVIQQYYDNGSHDESGYTYSFLTPMLYGNCKSVAYYCDIDISKYKLTTSDINYYKFNPQSHNCWDIDISYHKLCKMVD